MAARKKAKPAKSGAKKKAASGRSAAPKKKTAPKKKSGAGKKKAAAKKGASKKKAPAAKKKASTRQPAPKTKSPAAPKKDTATQQASAPQKTPTRSEAAPAAPAASATSGGPVSASAVTLGHVFSLRPRVNTGFRPPDFQQAKRDLAETGFATIEAATRAVADKALELTRGGSARPRSPKRR